MPCANYNAELALRRRGGRSGGHARQIPYSAVAVEEHLTVRTKGWRRYFLAAEGLD